VTNWPATELGLTHGYANLVVLTAKERAAGGPASAQDLVDGQYRGKENLRPIYEAVLAAATALGTDVEVVPKKAGVSLRRSKQFALVAPTTKTRADLGINLKGVGPTKRLLEVGGMCTHKVAITDRAQIDAELLGWLTEAYEKA
jgi:predicted transport protein